MKLPHDANAENAVLGSIILEPDVLPLVLDYITTAEQFYIRKNQQVYATMLELFADGKPIDLVEISAKTGDIKYLTELANVTPTSANVEFYARIVKEKAIRRELYRACVNGAEAARCEVSELDEVVATIETSIQNAGDQTFQGKIRHIKELAKSRWNEYYSEKDRSKNVGVKSGFTDLDDMITCFKNGEMTVIAGRTSMGKTSFSLDVVRNVAKQGVPALVFSLEMRAERVADRLICAEGMLPGQLFRKGEYVNRDSLSKAIAAVHNMPIFVYDQRATTAEIKSKSMRVKNLGLVVVDFLTLIKDKRGRNFSTADHVGEIAKKLQETAKELNIPFLVLSQMNRDIERRESKKPNLSDLRDSGNIEEAADCILFLHRPSYYDDSQPKEIATVYVAKQRDGPTGMVKLRYFDVVPTFRNLGRDYHAMGRTSGQEVLYGD